MATSGVKSRHASCQECTICSGSFTDPRVLPCSHAFCFSCVQDWCGSRRPLDIATCPNCSGEFSVPAQGLHDLPKKSAASVVPVCASGKLAPIHPNFICDECLEYGATSCGTCRRTLCEECAQRHDTSPATQHHMNHVTLAYWPSVMPTAAEGGKTPITTLPPPISDGNVIDYTCSIVRAIATLGDEVFIMRSVKPGVERVEAFDAKSMIWKNCLSLPDDFSEQVSHGVTSGTIATCGSYHCIYVGITDGASEKCRVYRVKLRNVSDIDRSWSAPFGSRLSVSSTHHVLAVGSASELDKNGRQITAISEYNTYGILLRKVTIQPGTVSHLVHALQLDANSFAVCHLRPFRGMSIVGDDGQLIRSYAEFESDSSRAFDVRSPPKCSVVHASGCIIVACHTAILVFRREALFGKKLPVITLSELVGIVDVCLDESRDRLYVAEGVPGGRVLVVDKVSASF